MFLIPPTRKDREQLLLWARASEVGETIVKHKGSFEVGHRPLDIMVVVNKEDIAETPNAPLSARDEGNKNR
jgi:hypothetical protein